MSLFDALKLLVLGVLLLFLATKCPGKDQFKMAYLKAAATDKSPNSP